MRTLDPGLGAVGRACDSAPVSESAAPAVGPKQSTDLRLVSWNLAKRVSRTEAVLDYLDAVECDVALLQESRVHDPAAARGWAVVQAAESPSDCVVMARPQISIRRAEPSAVSQLGRYVAHAEIETGARRLAVMSVHPLPATVPLAQLSHLPKIDVERPSDQRLWWSDLFLYLATHAVADRPAVLGGDWNTSRLFEDALFDRAAAFGWLEVLPLLRGSQQRTWFRGNERPHGLDHFFCSPNLRSSIRAGAVDATVADSAAGHTGLALSDHAPVIMDLAVVTGPQE
jgi:exonuclease III